MKLWPFQQDTVREYEALSKKYKRIVIVLPTGGGKTVVAAEIIRREVEVGRRVLFLSLPREQVDQAFSRLKAWGIAERDIGTILADESEDRANPSACVQIASLASFISRKLRKDDLPPADLVVIDEAHHAVAESYRLVLEKYPEARVVGLTATPVRYDGRGLAEVGFDCLLVGATTMQLGSSGFLTMPRVWSIHDEKLVDLRGIRADAYGDFAIGEAAARMSRAKIVGRHVEHYEKHGGGRSAVVYACTIPHAKTIAQRFREAGHEVELLFSKEHTSYEERSRILGRLERAEPIVVVNVAVLTEGWDCPAAKVCIIARPTRSWTLHMQIIGRFLRPWGAVTPTILDHAGNVCRLGMPDAEREFRLVMPKQVKGEDAGPQARACLECGAVSPLGVMTCVECGAEFPKRESPEEEDGELIEYTGASREQLIYVAKKHGYHPGWVDFALKAIEKEAR